VGWEGYSWGLYDLLKSIRLESLKKTTKTFPWLGLQVSIPEGQVGWVTSVQICNSFQHSHLPQYLAYYKYYIMKHDLSMFVGSYSKACSSLTF
jgi:hypothetical protein